MMNKYRNNVIGQYRCRLEIWSRWNTVGEICVDDFNVTRDTGEYSGNKRLHL